MTRRRSAVAALTAAAIAAAAAVACPTSSYAIPVKTQKFTCTTRQGAKFPAAVTYSIIGKGANRVVVYQYADSLDDRDHVTIDQEYIWSATTGKKLNAAPFGTRLKGDAWWLLRLHLVAHLAEDVYFFPMPDWANTYCDINVVTKWLR